MGRAGGDGRAQPPSPGPGVHRSKMAEVSEELKSEREKRRALEVRGEPSGRGGLGRCWALTPPLPTRFR